MLYIQMKERYVRTVGFRLVGRFVNSPPGGAFSNSIAHTEAKTGFGFLCSQSLAVVHNGWYTVPVYQPWRKAANSFGPKVES